MMYLFHSFSGEEYSDPELSHQEEADQEESEVGLTTLASEPEEIYLLKLLQKSLIKRLSGSEIVLMNDYEINHVSGNYDIYVCSVNILFGIVFLLSSIYEIYSLEIQQHFVEVPSSFTDFIPITTNVTPHIQCVIFELEIFKRLTLNYVNNYTLG